MGWYRKVLASSLVESVVFSALAGAAALGGQLGLQIPFFDGLGFVLLILSCVLMLIGGAMSFATPGTAKTLSLLTGKKFDPGRQDFVRVQHRAALYATTGVILFAETLVLAASTFALA